MEGWQKEALIRHRVAILDDMYVDYVVDHLIANEILHPDHIERIFEQSGRRARARHLLDLLPSLGPSAFHEFVASLRKPYNWLADSLIQESGSITTSIEVSSPICSNNALDKQPKVGMLSEEICQLLSTLSSVASASGTSLCAIGDSLAVLVQTMKVVDNISDEQSSVTQRNSVNASNGERNLTRLKGGCNLDIQGTQGNERSTTEIEETISITEEKWKVNNVEGMGEKVVGNICDIEASVSSAYMNEMREELVLGEVMGLSREVDLPINSPDSGIISEEMACISLSYPNEINGFDKETGRNTTVPLDNLPDVDKTVASLKKSSEHTKSNPTTNMELMPLLDEVERMRHSLTDIVGALKSVVKLSDRTLKIANSISN